MTVSSFVIFLFVTLLASIGWSGWQDIGNGGDVVICENMVAKKMTYTAYDRYEAIKRYRIKIVMPSHSQDAIASVNELLLRLPQGYQRLREQALIFALNMENEASYVDSLPDARDVGIGYLDHQCRIEQLILQKEPQQAGESYYRINRPIWINLSEFDKAIMMIHEALYRLSPVARKIYSSESIRYVVANLLANSFEGMSADEVDRIMDAAGLK